MFPLSQNTSRGSKPYDQKTGADDFIFPDFPNVNGKTIGLSFVSFSEYFPERAMESER